jgi:hypothetical protein
MLSLTPPKHEILGNSLAMMHVTFGGYYNVTILSLFYLGLFGLVPRKPSLSGLGIGISILNVQANKLKTMRPTWVIRIA